MSTAINPIHTLNTISHEQAHKLACAANALAAKQLRTIRFGFFRPRKSALIGCNECHHTWPRAGQPEHAENCSVGRVQQMALGIIARYGLPCPKRPQPPDHPHRRRDDGPLPQHLLETKPGLRITEVPHQDAPSYGEPWAWNPELGVVVDLNGNTVANMLLTDLEPLEQKEFGRRIAVAVNFCRGVDNGELRKLDRIVETISEEEDGAEQPKPAVMN